MKILKVRFMNLNSLKGEHEISFDRSPLADSGIFAITGPTGSGKTTILDAITVGLYGKVHRHGRNTEEIMTRNTGECFSEVTFEVNGKQYRSKWSLVRARRLPAGNMQTARMELAEADGTLISDQRLAEVQDRIKDILNLDYEQFLKSVMLSQGDFARFLKSKDGERSELLEKITDTQVYTEISAFVFRYAKDIDDKLKNLRVVKEKMLPMVVTTEQKVAFEADLKQLNTDVQTGKSQLNATELNISWLNHIAELEKKKIEYETTLRQNDDEWDKNAVAFQRLQKHRSALPLKPELALADAAQLRIASLERRLQAYDDELPRQHVKVQQQQKEYERVSLLLHTGRENLEALNPVIDRTIKLDEQIKNEGATIIKLEKAFIDARSSQERTLVSLAHYEDRSRTLESGLIDLEAWLVANKNDEQLPEVLARFDGQLQQMDAGIADGKKLRTSETQQREELEKTTNIEKEAENAVHIIRTDISGLHDRMRKHEAQSQHILAGMTAADAERRVAELSIYIPAYHEMQRLSTRWGEEQGVILAGKAVITTVKQALAEKETLLKVQSNNLALANEKLADLSKIVALHKLVMNYEEARGMLEEDEPCPLCGSTHHPYKEYGYTNTLTEDQKRLDRQEVFVNEIVGLMNGTRLEINSLHGQQQAETNRLNRAEQIVLDVLQKFESSATLVPVKMGIGEGDSIAQQLSAMEQENLSIAAKIKQSADAERMQNGMQQQLLTSERLLAEKEGLALTLKEVIKSAEKELSATLNRFSELRAQYDNYQASLNELLHSYYINFEYNRRAEIKSDLYNRVVIFRKNTTDKSKLELEAANTKKDREASSATMQDIANRMAEMKHELEDTTFKLRRINEERQQLFADKNPIAERTRLNGDLELLRKETEAARLLTDNFTKELQQLVTKRDNDQRTLANENELSEQQLLALVVGVTAAGFVDIEEARAALLDADVADNIEKLERKLGTIRTTTQNQLDEIASAIILAGIQKKTDEPLENLVDLSIQLKNEIDKLTEHIGAIREKINAGNKLDAEYGRLVQEETALSENHTRWQKLNALIGSDSGAKFRKYAQGITLQRLTEFANRHLRQLSDRYKIVKTESKDLELQVSDAYQAEMVRPVNTLSGGESFLVSLALALGLSDMAGRKVQINSLFIDEGFGTLDADTLDVALDALDKLQSGGKMIGIITHVDLRERINTQIQVAKVSAGFSKIKIVSGGLLVS